MTTTLEALTAFDTRLSRRGLFTLTPFWADTLSKFYTHPTAKRLVARVGRGGAKSTTCVRVACFEVLHHDWAVPEGEVHYFAIVSGLKTEAADRRRQIRATLDTLGIAYENQGDAIIIPERRVGFRVFASSGEAVRGFRCIGYIADELAFWPWDSSSSDPAGEVLASLDAMCITHPDGRSFLISSPWSVDDAHALAFDRGDTEYQCTAYATSWDANPTITREDCLAKAEGDPNRFRRDYEAIAGVTVAQAFDVEDLDAAFVRTPETPVGMPIVGADPSQMMHDSYAWTVATADADGGLVFQWACSLDASSHLTTKHAAAALAADAERYGAKKVVADSYGKAWVTDEITAYGLNYLAISWTQDSKFRAVEVLRRLLRDGRVSFFPHPRLKSELYGLKRRLSSGGVETFDTNGKDYLSAVLAVCMAVSTGDMALSGFGDDSYAAFARRPGRDGNGGQGSPLPEAVFAQVQLLYALKGQPENMTDQDLRAVAETLAGAGIDPTDENVERLRYFLKNGSSTHYGGVLGTMP